MGSTHAPCPQSRLVDHSPWPADYCAPSPPAGRTQAPAAPSPNLAYLFHGRLILRASSWEKTPQRSRSPRGPLSSGPHQRVAGRRRLATSGSVGGLKTPHSPLFLPGRTGSGSLAKFLAPRGSLTDTNITDQREVGASRRRCYSSGHWFLGPWGRSGTPKELGEKLAPAAVSRPRCPRPDIQRMAAEHASASCNWRSGSARSLAFGRCSRVRSAPWLVPHRLPAVTGWPNLPRTWHGSSRMPPRDERHDS